MDALDGVTCDLESTQSPCIGSTHEADSMQQPNRVQTDNDEITMKLAVDVVPPSGVPNRELEGSSGQQEVAPAVGEQVSDPRREVPLDQDLIEVPGYCSSSEGVDVLNSCDEPISASTAPTASSSRAFFVEQEALLQAQIAAAAAAGLSKTPSARQVECPPLILNTERLNQLMLTVSSAYNVEHVGSLLCRDAAAAVAAVNSSGGSVFRAIHHQFESCLSLLAGPSKPDWKCPRKSIAEAHPHALFDRLLPLANIVDATSAVWTFSETEVATIAGSLQALLVKTYECQQKLLAGGSRGYAARRAATPSTTTSCSESVENVTRKDQSMEARALERICGAIDRSVRRGLAHSRSLLSSANSPGPQAFGKLAYLINIRRSPTTPTAAQLLPLPNVAAGVASAFQEPVDLYNFVTTVDAVSSSDPCKQLLGSVEVRAAISVLFSLRALAIELSKQRQVDWTNSAARATVAAALAEAERCFTRSAASGNLQLIPGATNIHADAVAGRHPTSTLTLSPQSPHRAATGRSGGAPSFTGASSGPGTATPVRRATAAALIEGAGSSVSIDESLGAENGAVAAIEARMEQDLRELFRCYRGAYRLAGSLLGGPYAEADVQFELAGTSVIGTYISTISFLFFDELSAIANFANPWLPEVRRTLKQQSAPVNQVTNTVASANDVSGASCGSGDKSVPKTARPPTTSPRMASAAAASGSASSGSAASGSAASGSAASGSAASGSTTSAVPFELISSAPVASLQQLLRSPSALSLTRAFEGRAILMLLFPSALASSGMSKVAAPEKAPADRINRLLVWLLWEAGVGAALDQFERLSRTAASEGTSPTVDELVTDALVASVLIGARVVHNKFVSSTHLFVNADEAASRISPQAAPQVPPNCTWRGEEVLDLCARVGEALSLRHLGEIDVRGGRLKPTTGVGTRLQRISLDILATRTLPERSMQVSTRILESLPKLFGEFLHQCLFYETPIRAVEDLMTFQHANTMACSIAVGTRSTGQIADLIVQMLSTQKCAVAALLNSHANFRNFNQLEERVDRLGQQLQSLSDGPLARHTNQIKTHTNRLEEHTAELRTLRGLITTQQTLQTNNASEIKRVQEHLLQVSTTGPKLNDHLQNVERAVDRQLSEFEMASKERTEKLFDEAIGAALVQERQRVDDRMMSEARKASQGAIERAAAMEGKVAQDMALLRDSTEKSLVLTRQVQRAFCDSVIARCRDELSSFLVEHLEEKVAECLRELSRQQEGATSGPRHRRFLSWGMSHSPAASVLRSGAPATSRSDANRRAAGAGGSATTPNPPTTKRLDATPSAPPTLINTTKWPFQGPTYSAERSFFADDLTSVADTSSVQDEAGHELLHQQFDPFLLASAGAGSSYWDSASTSSAAGAPENLLHLGDGRTVSSRSLCSASNGKDSC